MSFLAVFWVMPKSESAIVTRHDIIAGQVCFFGHSEGFLGPVIYSSNSALTKRRGATRRGMEISCTQHKDRKLSNFLRLVWRLNECLAVAKTQKKSRAIFQVFHPGKKFLERLTQKNFKTMSFGRPNGKRTVKGSEVVAPEVFHVDPPTPVHPISETMFFPGPHVVSPGQNWTGWNKTPWNVTCLVTCPNNFDSEFFGRAIAAHKRGWKSRKKTRDRFWILARAKSSFNRPSTNGKNNGKEFSFDVCQDGHFLRAASRRQKKRRVALTRIPKFNGNFFASLRLPAAQQVTHDVEQSMPTTTMICFLH